VTRLSTISLDTARVGRSDIAGGYPFGPLKSLHAQYLYRKNELHTVGLNPGEVTGFRFQTPTYDPPPGKLTRVLIRMKNTTKDSIDVSSYESGGFTTVYSGDINFTKGVNTLQFFSPFVWDSSLSIIVDVSSDQNQNNVGAAVYGTFPPPKKTTLISRYDPNVLHFEGGDFIEVPPQTFAEPYNVVDSEITIAFWQYGDPAKQPQNQSSFEAVDAYGQRVLNAHVPWSDTVVYWDAGTKYQKYDRISKKALQSDISGKWTHWAFTKNVRTGSMKIYMNGTLWSSGSAKRKPMSGIARFRIGSGANGSNNFAGDIDAFRIYSRELSAPEIMSLVTGEDAPLIATNPILVYDFTDADPAFARNTSNFGALLDGKLVGRPTYKTVPARDMYRGFLSLGDLTRPVITFEQGKYTTKIDTIVKVDSTIKDNIMVIRYARRVEGHRYYLCVSDVRE
jgi:hypothetical protein